MSHQCKAILIHCMDFRLVEKIRQWIKEQGLIGNCDLVSLAGAGKGVADGNKTGEILLEQIGISIKLHNTSQVILLHHSDCGAYKSSYGFSSKDNERIKQEDDIKKAENVIKEKFSGIEIIKIWAEMKDSEGREIDFNRII